MVEGGWKGEGLHGGPRTTMTRQVDALLGTGVFFCFLAIFGQGRLWSAAFFFSSCNDVTQSGTAPQSERTVQRGLE